MARYKLSISSDEFVCGICKRKIPPETEFYLRGSQDARCKQCREDLAWRPPALTPDLNILGKIAKLKKLDDKVCFLVVHYHCLGNVRKVDSDEVEVEADKSRISVMKRLLQSPEYEVIKGFDSMVMKEIDRLALLNADIPGARIIPIALVEQAENILQAAATKRKEVLVPRFVKAYPALKAAAQQPKAKGGLGPLFSEEDYPPAEQVAHYFSMDWQYLEFSTPGSLGVIAPAVFKDEREKAQKKFQETFAEIRDTMRLGLLTLVNNLKEALKPGDDGKAKKLTATAVEKLKGWLELSPFKNVNNDADLQNITDELTKLMDGVDREKLAENEGLQERVQKTMASVAGKLEVMVKPIRKFRIG